jgi:hypothetical protein
VGADKGYIKIYSNGLAFAALRADGSIKAWGDPDFGGKHAPTDKGYTKIYSNTYDLGIAFARRRICTSIIRTTPRCD